MNLTRAVVRPPSPDFADGLTSADLGKPSYALAMTQHARYCEELRRCGLALTRLPATDGFPDATFVEDTAILTARGAILCRPGADSRKGEVASVADALVSLMPALGSIEAPGTVDGGDVCDAGDRFLIGLSTRTNEDGARQLVALLAKNGHDATVVDLRDSPDLLHLKSGLAALGDGRLVAVDALAGKAELRGRTFVRVTPEEAYAANCIAVNGRVLIASGFPRLLEALVRLRYDVVTLDMSEFRKMDGGLSCLSLRS